MTKRDLTSLHDLSTKEILGLLDEALAMKKDKAKTRSDLFGKTVGLIFQKPSNRTRVSFDVGVHQLGGKGIYLGPEEIALGKRESTADVAKTLSRYLDAIVARVFNHDDVIELAREAEVPIINGLSDLYHPCQALADLLSIKEKFGNLENIRLAYVGDGNNVCHSLLLGCSKVGISVAVAAPEGYEPAAQVIADAQEFAKDSGAEIIITPDPRAAVKGARVIYADVWTSMGQEQEAQERLKVFQPYQINQNLALAAAKDYIFMHCLPAHRGQEVTAEIIDGEHSIVFDQAENRMHVQKAILSFLLKA